MMRNIGKYISSLSRHVRQYNLILNKRVPSPFISYINDINYLSSYIGLKAWFDTSLWHQEKYALSLSAIPELTFSISKIINSIFGKTKKCLVLDLDNTCWGGGIGDDGLHGIVKLIKQKHSRAIKPVAKAIEFNIHYAT